MSTKREFFEKNQPFHIISRAVEERNIFRNEGDCYRFLFQIYAANIGKPVLNLQRKDIIKITQALLLGEDISSKYIIIEHPPLVNIFDFSLVVNHYHFYLAANKENSVPLFMQRLNGGFAMYFNLKHGRKGSLFGSRYKSIPIKTDFQSTAVGRYVSIINPLDVYQPGWRESGLDNLEKAFSFLEKYQFSSFPDRIGKRESRLLASGNVLEKYGLWRGSANEYRQFVENFLKERLSSSEPIFLE